MNVRCLLCPVPPSPSSRGNRIRKTFDAKKKRKRLELFSLFTFRRRKNAVDHDPSLHSRQSGASEKSTKRRISVVEAETMSSSEMHQADYKVIKGLPGNNACMDCGGPNPQWASASLGTLLCIDCAGAHRGLGVHISFVRSVTMDSWSPEQIKIMKLGGNDSCRTYLSNHGVDLSPSTPIRDRYDNEAAQNYKTMLKARAQGASGSHPAMAITTKQPQHAAAAGKNALNPVSPAKTETTAKSDFSAFSAAAASTQPPRRSSKLPWSKGKGSSASTVQPSSTTPLQRVHQDTTTKIAPTPSSTKLKKRMEGFGNDPSYRPASEKEGHMVQRVAVFAAVSVSCVFYFLFGGQ